MQGFGVNTARQTTELSALNHVLLLCGMMPVSSVANLVAGSDAYMANTALQHTVRTELEKGWYCWNKVDNEELVIAANGSITTVYPVCYFEVSARTKRELCDLPRLGISASDGLITAERIADISKMTAHAGKSVYLDVIYWRDPWTTYSVTASNAAASAPAALITYCAVKAAALLAPNVGGVVSKEVIQEATDNLWRVEAAATPRSNMYDDNPETLLTWADR